MKRNFVLSMLVFCFIGFSFQSCKDEEGAAGGTNTSTGILTDADKANLYDKVWYSTSSSGGIDHEFLSDNVIRQSQSLEGRWNWINRGDTMDILDHQNNRYRYLFKSISSNSMSLTTSIDNYKTLSSYRDTP